MKILKKINKGLILTIIVLLVLIIYVTSVEKQRDADKPEIKKICEEFIELTDKYSVLPEEMQTLQKEISENKVKEYTNQMETEMEKMMIPNKEAVKIQQQVLKDNLYDGYNALEVKTKQTRKIQKIAKYEFDGDQVTVSLRNQVNITIRTFNGIEEHTENKEFDASDDKIILQKIDGKWKVVYSNLRFNDTTRYRETELLEMY